MNLEDVLKINDEFYKIEIDKLREVIEIQSSKLAKAREALEFYADEKNWDSSGIVWKNQTVRDNGSKSREALKEVE